MNIPATSHDSLGLVAALAIGLLVGLERGWHDRDLPEGRRVAGLRTFALTGLFGGVLALLLPQFGAWPLVAGIVGLALLIATSYREAAQHSGNLSVTTAVAMLLTLVLGALAARGAIALALAAGVIVAVLLAFKPTLHGWLRVIEYRELTAALQLLVLTVVILPVLPDTGYGPYAALNPYRLWLAVILIAGLSLAGYLAMQVTGSQRGILLTGVLGGLASSTAATLTLARYTREQPALAATATAGIIAASGMMFLRMALVIGVMQPALRRSCSASLVATGLAFLALALWQWRRDSATPVPGVEPDAMEPFDLSTALGFGMFLAVMAVLVPAAQQWLGDSGVYVLAALSGLADVDAIVIALARLFGAGSLALDTTVLAIAVAALTNMTVKAGIARATGGTLLGGRVLRGYATAMGTGGLVVALIVYLA